MIVASYTTVNPNMSQTRTYEDFYKFLGAKPQRLGLMTRMYPNLTASYLTESLKNIFYMDHKKEQFKSLDSPYFEWDVDNNYIKQVTFAAVPTTLGENGEEIIMAFTERYYEKYDIFKIEKTRQQCIVVDRPVRKADNFWEYCVRLIDNDYSSILNTDGCQIGDATRFQSNAMPEMSEEGFVKSQSNMETHRNYITTFRNDIDYSSLFAATENVFIQVAQGKDVNSLVPTIYKMESKEKILLNNLLEVRNRGLLFNRTNVDKNGKATIHDPATGRPIIIGEGMLPQIERYCGKYVFNKLSISAFQAALAEMVLKAEKDTGNYFTFICNSKMWNMVQTVLGAFLANYKQNSTYMYSAAKNGYIDVGNTFQSYEFGGNKITFAVDRTFTLEWADKAFGMFIDTTADSVTGAPAIQLFSLKGGDFISSKYPGVGGLSGLESGIVSSPVAASKQIVMSYAGIAVFNPYRSYMMIEA